MTVLQQISEGLALMARAASIAILISSAS